MILHDAVIDAAKKRGKPGLYKDWRGNLWQVSNSRFHGELLWRAAPAFPWIVDKKESHETSPPQ